MGKTNAPTEMVLATIPGKVLEAADGKKGAVRALVSAYDVKYRIGYFTWHTIKAGAFDDAIAAGGALPLFWQHDWNALAPGAPIGHADIEESVAEGGLVIDGEFYTEDDPHVARIHRGILAGAIREWSIGYRVIESRVPDPSEPQHIEVTKAELLEASSVLRGANPSTDTLKVAGHFADPTITFDGQEFKLAEGEAGTIVLTPTTPPTPAADEAAEVTETPLTPDEFAERVALMAAHPALATHLGHRADTNNPGDTE